MPSVTAAASAPPAPAPADDAAASGKPGGSHVLLVIMEDVSDCEPGEDYDWQGADEGLPYPGSSSNSTSDRAF